MNVRNGSDDSFPLLPFRSTLYRAEELFAGFDPTRPGSYVDTPDFRAYRSTWIHPEHRGDSHPERDIGMLRALHDHCISDARDRLISGRRVMAIMGGHALRRDDPLYRTVVEMSAALTASGVLVATGGGPGAMEAAHLGALLARADVSVRDGAIAHLSKAAGFPASAAGIVEGNGEVCMPAVEELHEWQRRAFEVLAGVPVDERGESLAIPTWHYGHEPPTPFAGHIAKYFTNAIREDGLLAIAVDGVIFAPGRAGTLQEIFQEACQNYYRTVHRRFSPMAFLDHDAVWTERFPVEAILRPLFGDDVHDRHILTSEDPDELLGFLLSHDPLDDAHDRIRPAGPPHELPNEL